MTPNPTAARIPAPARPALIEGAAAILIVGGAFGVVELLFLGGAASGVDQGFRLLAIGLDLISIGAGLLARSGRSWVFVLNLAAIYAFLYFTALPNLTALLLGLAHLFVAAALVARRPWFDAMKAWREARDQPGPAPSEPDEAWRLRD